MTESLPPKYHKSIQRWLDAAVKKMGSPELVGKLDWIFNSNLTVTMGRIHFYKGTIVFHSLLEEPYTTYRPKVIEFSPLLFSRATVAQRRWVVYHEAAHAVDAHQGTMKLGSVHGKSWQDLMQRAGVPAKRFHDVQVDRRKRRKKV